MHIKSIEINQYMQDKLGLSRQKISALERIIVVCGENGCGKTRLFSVIHWLLEQNLISGYDEIISTFNKKKSLDDCMNNDEDMSHYTRTALGEEKEIIERLAGSVSGLSLFFDKNESKNESLSLYIKISKFLNTKPKEIDYGARLSIGYPKGRDGNFDRNILTLNPLVYVKDICVRWIKESESSESRVGFYSADEGIETAYYELLDLIYRIMDVKLTIDKNYIVKFDGVSLDELHISKGQELLIRWVVLIHSKILETVSIPIILDEPELHLHPRALNVLFDEILKSAPNVQFWIGTHSLPLISHLSYLYPRSVWYGKNGKFVRAGNNPPLVMEGLLGGDSGLPALLDFCNKAEDFALNSFAADCLLQPQSVPYQTGDPQVNQVFNLFKELNSDCITIVDLGAGQGRLLEGLAAKCIENNININDRFAYFAVEPFDEVRNRCIEVVSEHYKDGADRVFATLSEVEDSLGKQSVNVIIMTNVLHEIQPYEWIDCVFGNSSFSSILDDNGYFIIVEDTRLSRGELAHPAGFIVLEEAAFQVMFGVDKSDSSFFSTRCEKYKDRLQATVVSKNLLSNVTTETIRCAIEKQKEMALEGIRRLRAADRKPTYSNGREHAYLAQLVTNSLIVLDEWAKFSDNVSN